MKAVRFSSDLCIYHFGAVLDMEFAEESDLWYQTDELKRIKREALLLSRDACANFLSPLLSKTYCKADSGTENSITSWVVSCDSRRGLERFVSKDYSSKRSDTRMRNMRVILTAQHKMKNEGLQNTDYMSTLLCRLSEEFSKDSFKYAYIMGRADMMVTGTDISISHIYTEQNYITCGRTIDTAEVLKVSSVDKNFTGEKVVPIYSPNLIVGSIMAHRGFNEMRHFY